jgi:ATP-binding cassette subfamily F protein 3
LDDYPAWLAEQVQKRGAIETDSASDNTTKLSKKELRQAEAQRREALKPLLQKVKKAEDAMSKARMEIEVIEKKLHDDSLYSDSTRREELTMLVQRQAQARQELEKAEEIWLEGSEELERTNTEG